MYNHPTVLKASMVLRSIKIWNDLCVVPVFYSLNILQHLKLLKKISLLRLKII